MVDEPNQPDPNAAPPAGTEPPDDEKLGGLVEAAVRKVFAEATKPEPPAAPAKPSGGGAAPVASPSEATSLAGMIEAAVNRALKERDEQDIMATLHDEIEQLKAKVAAAPAARRRGWGSYLLGPGLPR